MKLTSDSQQVVFLGAAVATVGLAALVLARRRPSTGTQIPLGPALNPMALRKDAAGDGHFEASRIGHIHQGTDFLCRPGQSVYAPHAGVIIREAIVYPADPQWRGLVIKSDDGYESKLFYCLPAGSDLVGQFVGRGQLVGFCQSISRKYGGSMHDHVHIEVRRNGVLLNPELLFKFTQA